ncbi:MAG: hypothetical protein GX446_09245, partial [Chthonomonadales bacterium]|nr:hypothetical protein [Chthonomonadales bacterium]
MRNRLEPCRLLRAAIRWALIIGVSSVVLSRGILARLDQRQWMVDAGFEKLKPGALEAASPNTGWEVQRVGREMISGLLRVECVRDPRASRSGNQCVSLSIPGNTEGFEYVTLGQRIPIDSGCVYSVSAWVRWADGPVEAPKGASRTSGHRSAVVSFWSRFANGAGAFAGRDVWLFDNRWRRLSYRFCVPDASDRALVYLSLLPNQRPVATTVMVDDFTLTSLPMPKVRRTIDEHVTHDASLSSQSGRTLTSPWSFASMGGPHIRHSVCEEDGNRFVRFTMPDSTPGTVSAQMFQSVGLRAGAHYEVSCRIRWENCAHSDRAPIANFGLYHERSDTWYGPVDIALDPTAEWRTYRFTHVPPSDGVYKLYVGVNG